MSEASRQGLRTTAGAGRPRIAPTNAFVLQRRQARWDLTVRDLRLAYGDQEALHGINVRVPEDSCVAVLGANGAGKTSLLNAVSGLHRPVRGSVRFGTTELGPLTAHEIYHLGVCHIPEGRGVFPDLTVADNLRLMIGDTDSTCDKVFERFPRLKERWSQRAGTMSGGEQQMLAVAPAVVGDYRILLVDEISLGLAPVIVDELFEFLADVRARGVTVVLVEQFAERALALAETVYVLKKGEVVLHGAAAELRGRNDELHDLYMGGGGAHDSTSEPQRAGDTDVAEPVASGSAGASRTKRRRANRLRADGDGVQT